MEDSIESLLLLQEWDAKYIQAEQNLRFLPNEYDLLNKKINEAKNQIETNQKALIDIEFKRRQMDAKIKDLEENVLKFKTQQLSIKKQEEYQAMEKQLAQMNEEIDHLEYEELGLMLEIEEHQKDFEKHKEIHENRIDELLAERKLLDKKQTVLENEIKLFQFKTNEYRKIVQKEFLEAYDQSKIRVKKPPFVVKIIDHRCQGCFLKVSNAIDKIARKLDEPHFCDNCGRIVYVQID